MSALAVTLEATKAILANSGRWTREAMARNRRGDEVKPEDPEARCFCMVGALRRAAKTNTDFELGIRALRKACKGQSIFTFNGSHGHRAVLKALNRAITEARAQ